MHIRFAFLYVVTSFFVFSGPAMPAPKATPSKLAKVTIFYPKPATNSALAEFFRATVDVIIDGKKVGVVDVGKPLSLDLTPGPHKLRLLHSSDPLESMLNNSESTINAYAGKPLFFYVYHTGSSPRANEVDAATAQAEISGIPAKTASGTATVIIYWPRGLLDFGLFDALKSDVAVKIDERQVGAITGGDYLVAKVPSGKHALVIQAGFAFLGATVQENMFLAAGKTHYFRLTYRQYFELNEAPNEQGGAELKGLRQR